MIVIHPIALVGLLALAGPILIHLLVRREAVRVRFPTLRFIRATRSASIRRHRLGDWPLLAVRLAILAIAALALADPVWVRLSRAAAARRVSRAIVVDVSRSMDRREASGRLSLRDAARAAAGARAAAASASATFENGPLAQGLAAACDWLERVPPSRREVLVLSDFQRGAFDPAMLACVPADTAIELEAIVAAPAASSFEGQRIVRARTEAIAAVSVSDQETIVAYVPTGLPGAAPPLVIFAREDERLVADAARHAAIDAGVPSASERPIVIVLAHAAERDDLDRRVSALTERWMWDAVQRIEHDITLASVANTTARSHDIAPLTCSSGPSRASGSPRAWFSGVSVRKYYRAAPLSRPESSRRTLEAAVPIQLIQATRGDHRCAVIGRDRTGAALVHAAADRTRLVLFLDTGAASLMTPALVQAALSARAPFAYAEHEPAAWNAAALQALERPGGDPPAALVRNETTGAGRAGWILVLAALAVEMWMRRPRDVETSQESVDVRVA